MKSSFSLIIVSEGLNFIFLFLDINFLVKKMDEMKADMSKAHGKTDSALSIINQNIINPSEGLWAETKQNTQFRENSQKWRGIVGIGFVGLVIIMLALLLLLIKIFKKYGNRFDFFYYPLCVFIRALCAFDICLW